MSSEVGPLDLNALIEPNEPGSHPLAWLLDTLRQALEELMAGDATPLQKANAAVRLGGLYLKTYQTSELEKENRALKERAAELDRMLGGAREEIAHMNSVAADWVAWLEPDDPAAEPWRELAGLPPRMPATDQRLPGEPRSGGAGTARFHEIRSVLNVPLNGTGAATTPPPGEPGA